MDTKTSDIETAGQAKGVGSGVLLAGFSPLEQRAILATLETHTVDQFNTIPEVEWRRFRGCGDRFIVRLIQRGWIGERYDILRADARPKPTAAEIQARKNLRRSEHLRGAISRARARLATWERELAGLNG